MTTDRKKEFDEAILLVLSTSGSQRFGLTVQAIRLLLPRFGFTVTIEEIDAEIFYLLDLCYIIEVGKGDFNPQHRTYRITAVGANYLNEHGL